MSFGAGGCGTGWGSGRLPGGPGCRGRRSGSTCTIEASAWRTHEGTRLSFLASADRAQAERYTNPEPPGFEAVLKQAEAINARLGGRIYTLPGYKTEQFTRRLQDLLAPAATP